MVVVYLGLRNFMKSKVGNALISIAAGAAVYFFLNDPTRVFDAFGKIIENYLWIRRIVKWIGNLMIIRLFMRNLIAYNRLQAIGVFHFQLH